MSKIQPFKAKEMPHKIFNKPSKLPAVEKPKCTMFLEMNLKTQGIKQKVVETTEELELKECKQAKAIPLDKRIFEPIQERKSCPPPQATMFKEFNFKIAQRPQKEVQAEAFSQFKARPMPVFGNPGSPKSRVSCEPRREPIKVEEFNLATNKRVTERVSAPPLSTCSLHSEFKASKMPDFKKMH